MAFYIFEVGLVATLQAFIFATLTAIYFGGAVDDAPLAQLWKEIQLDISADILPVIAQAADPDARA